MISVSTTLSTKTMHVSDAKNLIPHINTEREGGLFDI